MKQERGSYVTKVCPGVTGYSQMSPSERANAKRATRKTTDKVKTWKHPIRKRHVKQSIS